MPSKYLILQTPEGEKAVIFPEENFFHDEMAERLGSLGIIAAGFVQIGDNGKVHCFGRSESLDIEELFSCRLGQKPTNFPCYGPAQETVCSNGSGTFSGEPIQD